MTESALSQPNQAHQHAHAQAHSHAHPASVNAASSKRVTPTRVLGWPAWQRVLVVLPVVALLWLAVAWGSVNEALLVRVDAALHAVGLVGFEQRAIRSLSSGQFQRVLFARMLVQEAELILLDEPFTAMDARTTTALLELIHQWHDQGRTVIAVLHDDAQVKAHFAQTLLLARELVAWGDTAQVLTPPNLQRARALAEAWDDTAEICHTDEAVPS